MKQIFFTIFLLFIVLSSCKRGSGQGGSSSIRGKIYEYKYNANFSAKLDSGYSDNENVYIIYGDDPTFGDDQKTSYNGVYEFNYLRKGKYTIFAYSNDSTKYPNSGNKAILQTVEITKNKQTIEVPDMIILK